MRRRQNIIANSDDESDSDHGNLSEEQPDPSKRSQTDLAQYDPFTPPKREKRTKTRHQEDELLTNEVNALEISPRPSSVSSHSPSLMSRRLFPVLDWHENQRKDPENSTDPASRETPSTPDTRPPLVPLLKPLNENNISRPDDAIAEILATPASKQVNNDNISLSPPMVTSTPVQQSISSQEELPKINTVIVSELIEDQVAITPLTKPKFPRISQLQMSEFPLSQNSNDGLVAISPSKGRLRSLAAEQALLDKDTPATPRMVISKLVLMNFKSYYGRQEIGPFHSVSLLLFKALPLRF